MAEATLEVSEEAVFVCRSLTTQLAEGDFPFT